MQFSAIGIVCSKSSIHPPEAEGQKPVSGMPIVKMQKGIVVKGITQICITLKGISQIDVTRKCITQIGITRKGTTQIDITQRDRGVGSMNSQMLSQDILIGRRYQPLEHHLLRALTKRYEGSCCFDFRTRPVPSYGRCLFCMMPVCVMPFRVTFFCIMPFRVMPFCVTPFRVTPICVMPFRVMSFRVMPFRVMHICVMPFTTVPFCILTIYIPETSFYPSASGGCIHDLEHTIPIT